PVWAPADAHAFMWTQTMRARPALSEQSESKGDRLTAEVLKGLAFRSIGPAIQTGRVQDIAIDPRSPNTWYIATAFRGLWKTTNRRTTFSPEFVGRRTVHPRL